MQSKPSLSSSDHYIGLTEVEEHADEDNEAKPGVEIRHKVNNGNDDVCYSRQDGENNVAVRTRREFISLTKLDKVKECLCSQYLQHCSH